MDNKLYIDDFIELPFKVGDPMMVNYKGEKYFTKVFSMAIESEDDHWVFYCKCKVEDEFHIFRYEKNCWRAYHF